MNGVVDCIDFDDYLFASFVFVCFRMPSGVMRINIPNSNRYFIVAEAVRDRCVVISAATATWGNVDVVDM